MINHDFITIPVTDGTEIDIYIALQEGNEPAPAVIVLQEAFGVNGHIRKVAERLYNEGYNVVAPDLFHRTGKRLELPYGDFSVVMPHYQAITHEGLEADLTACFAWLQQQPSVVPGKVASIGFCLGGRVAFIANTCLPLSAAISYYGGGLDILTEDAVKLHGPQLFFWGGLDSHITPEKRNAIVEAVDKAGKPYVNTVFSYADHAFSCDERPSYHPRAAKEAWAMSLAFLENNLK